MATLRKGAKPQHTPGPEHVMNFPILDLGYPPASRRTVSIVDTDVHVYGVDEVAGSSLPIGIVIISHGRCNSAKNMHAMASGLLGELRRLERESATAKHPRRKVRDYVVATIDGRNHGQRTKYRERNLSYDHNPLHLMDMASTIEGGVHDHRLLLDFLPAYLFPRDERVVDEFMAVGVSMGGHTVWRLLREEPRVRIAVPIISMSPEALGPNLVFRASQYGLDDPVYTAQVRRYLETPSVPGVYKGKKILSIHGGKDDLLPLDKSQPYLDVVIRENQANEVMIWVDPEAGHKISPAMVTKSAWWLWKWGFSKPVKSVSWAKL
ncbi:hypothetical protein Q8F55_003352 [Vanrija albida]|uniref:Peptidase S9 prolyl oligopeptidase catalytic domain-containing protein n=1 Tax=Vanrija albida TaxID=181172 RepID=A0ABR3Q404_9TREE